MDPFEGEKARCLQILNSTGTMALQFQNVLASLRSDGARAAFLRAEPTGARFTPMHFTRWAHAALACCPQPRRSSFVDRLGRPDTVDVRVRRPAGGAEPRPAVSALRQVQPAPRP